MSVIQRAGLALGVLFLLGAAAATFIPTSPEGVTCGNWIDREWNDEAVDEMGEDGAALYEQDFTGEFGPEPWHSPRQHARTRGSVTTH